jgi:hypothetical protein
MRSSILTCPAAKLAVEVDGSHHTEDTQAGRDEGRDFWLREQGVKVYRAFSVFRGLDAVADGVRIVALDHVAERSSGGAAAPSPIRSSADGPPPPLRRGGKD